MSDLFNGEHLKSGTLVLIGGSIPGIIVKRISRTEYIVFAQGKNHTVHRDIMVKNDD